MCYPHAINLQLYLRTITIGTSIGTADDYFSPTSMDLGRYARKGDAAVASNLFYLLVVVHFVHVRMLEALKGLWSKELNSSQRGGPRSGSPLSHDRQGRHNSISTSYDQKQLAQ